MATNADTLGIPFGKFLLIDRLGRGGMAEVWKAKALGPRGYARKLVVKRVLPELVTDEEFVRMFAEEARLSASLNHRNIVQVYEFGEVGGEYYLTMEWVHGRDLNTLLRAVRERHAEPSVGLAAYVGREVCRALAYAHALTDEDGAPLGLIHRDVSPSNVMLGFDGSVKLLDFGIAKAMAVATENRTQAGVVKGKFGYMSPEQVDDDGDPIDHRADLFVAGIVLWEMLTSRRLFKGPNEVQTVGMVRAAKVAPPSTVNPAVPPELDAICMRALARARDERFADCGAMAEALDEVVHTLKFGSENASRLVRRLFPHAPEPTQQLSLVALPEQTPSHRLAERTPSVTPLAAPAQRVASPLPPSATTLRGRHVENAPMQLLDVRPSAKTALRKALHTLAAPTLGRERRVVLATAALVAFVAVVMVVRRPAPAAPVVVAPLVGAPWLTIAAPPPEAAPASATASARAPERAAAPSRPATVTIQLTTRPAGATVTVGDEPAPHGVTPLTLRLLRGTTPLRLVLSAPGHQRSVVEITPDVDSRLYYELPRASRQRRHAAPQSARLEPAAASDERVRLPAFHGIRGGD